MFPENVGPENEAYPIANPAKNTPTVIPIQIFWLTNTTSITKIPIKTEYLTIVKSIN